VEAREPGPGPGQGRDRRVSVAPGEGGRRPPAAGRGCHIPVTWLGRRGQREEERGAGGGEGEAECSFWAGLVGTMAHFRPGGPTMRALLVVAGTGHLDP
jgi:hypothetical protein